ncbi:hypothetical protein GBK23_03705 [Bifidobacterium longum]|nr:hypothetical protein GBL26_03965 [Bifidobacterium longum]KAB6735548.1 hypothetical protein GBK23_03705 [Bifidobacterium longum]KAB6745172.1 hypothetical protein GBK66_02865 [Bifidobacterium longum]
MFPATVFVSVASGHLTLLAVGQVLQRSLEPAHIGPQHAVGHVAGVSGIRRGIAGVHLHRRD